jgi:hypothetical protein
MMRSSASIVLACAAIGFAAPCAASAQSSPATALAPALFLVGCWRATDPDGSVIEESWSRPAGELMLGWSRTVRPGRTTQFEHLRIQPVGERLFYRPAPGGRPSEHDFRMTLSMRDQIVFEAPEHDFPKRIVYSLLPDGALRARIDGGAGSDQAAEWRMESVDCP